MTTLSVGVFVGLACWTVILAASVLGGLTLPITSRGRDVALLAPPAVFGLAWALLTRPATRALRIATAWSAVVAAVLWLTPQVLADSTIAYLFPGAIVLVWTMLRWPALGAALLLVVSASFGSLAAYLHFPYSKTLGALVAGLSLAGVLRFATHRERPATELPPAIAVVIVYLAFTVAQLLVAADRGLALSGFELAPVSLVLMLLIGYSQWSAVTITRVVRVLMVIALCVGAYAVLRLIIGPSSAERSLAVRDSFFSVYNFVGDKLKLLGSFPNGPDLAGWTSLMIPFCLACALGLKGRFRVMAIIALPLLAVAMFAAQARAAAAAGLIASLVVIALHGSSRVFGGMRFGRGVVAAWAVLVIGAGAYALGGASSANSGHSYLSLFSGAKGDASVALHQYKWSEAFRDLTGHPFGYGLGTAPSGYQAGPPVTPTYILPVTELSVDNGYLKVALEQGFSAMLIFAVGLAMLAVALGRRAIRAPDGLSATVIGGATGTLVSLMILEGAGAYADSIPARAAMVVIGMGIALAVRRGREPQVLAS